MMGIRRVALGASAALLAGAGYMATTWYRYGRTRAVPIGDELLDRFMPVYEVRERHQTRVRAPVEATFAAARALELSRSPLVRAIFRGRELLMGSSAGEARPPRPFLDEILSLGWRVLAEAPGREIVVGAVTQPWQADVVFRGVPPEEFAAFDEPDYVKIAWTLAVNPLGPDESVFRTETRVASTDLSARRKFRRYWAVVSPGILLIRREALRLVKQAAEGGSRSQARAISGRAASDISSFPHDRS
jgi:hypothetical protein